MRKFEDSELYLKKGCMSVLRKNTSSNITDVKNSSVTDDTAVSKTVSCASPVSEIDLN